MVPKRQDRKSKKNVPGGGHLILSGSPVSLVTKNGLISLPESQTVLNMDVDASKIMESSWLFVLKHDR